MTLRVSGRRLIAAALLFAGLGITPLGMHAAFAADWPTRQIQMVVPYPPGGSTDVVARDLADFLSKKLGQTTLVVNRPGASGTIGTNAVAKADPDGYTILMVQAGPINSFLTNKKLPYDPIRDFSYIIMFGRAPVVVSVAADSPFKSVADIVKAAKEKPGTITYGTPGIGTPAHIGAALFESITGTKLVHVPYTGSAGLITDLLGGQVQISFDVVSSMNNIIGSGKARGLALASSAKSVAMPQVPLGSEAGLPNWESYTYFGLATAKGLDKSIVDRVNGAVNEYVQLPASAKRFDELGVLSERGGTPAQAEAFIKSEIERLAPVVKAANITTE